MKKSYRTLEFSFIQDYIKNYCFSEMAKKRIDQIKPFQDIDDLKLYQDDISSAMKIIYAYGRIPLAPYEDIKEILQKAQKGGLSSRFIKNRTNIKKCTRGTSLFGSRN